MKHTAWMMVAMAFLLLLAACASKTPTPGTGAETPIPVVNTEAATQATSENVVNISIKGFAFNPDSLTVKVGTTVKWTNDDSVVHTVTSDTGLFDSGDLNPGDVFSFTFTAAGTYAYHCIPHHANMKGTVVVTE